MGVALARYARAHTHVHALYRVHLTLLLQEMQGTVGTSSLCTAELESWVKSLVRISSLIKLCGKNLRLPLNT